MRVIVRMKSCIEDSLNRIDSRIRPFTWNPRTNMSTKDASILLVIYAALLVAGGWIGYLKAKKPPEPDRRPHFRCDHPDLHGPDIQ